MLDPFPQPVSALSYLDCKLFGVALCLYNAYTMGTHSWLALKHYNKKMINIIINTTNNNNSD